MNVSVDLQANKYNLATAKSKLYSFEGKKVICWTKIKFQNVWIEKNSNNDDDATWVGYACVRVCVCVTWNTASKTTYSSVLRYHFHFCRPSFVCVGWNDQARVHTYMYARKRPSHPSFALSNKIIVCTMHTVHFIMRLITSDYWPTHKLKFMIIIAMIIAKLSLHELINGQLLHASTQDKKNVKINFHFILIKVCPISQFTHAHTHNTPSLSFSLHFYYDVIIIPSLNFDHGYVFVRIRAHCAVYSCHDIVPTEYGNSILTLFSFFFWSFRPYNLMVFNSPFCFYFQNATIWFYFKLSRIVICKKSICKSCFSRNCLYTKFILLFSYFCFEIVKSNI